MSIPISSKYAVVVVVVVIIIIIIIIEFLIAVVQGIYNSLLK